jgi:hypothetical protein
MRFTGGWRSQSSGAAPGWRNTRFPARVYGWLHRADSFDYTADLPWAKETLKSTIGSSGHRGLRLAPRAPDHSPGLQTGQLAAAKRRPSCIVWTGSENGRSELRSNSRARPRDFGPRAAFARQRSPPGPPPRLRGLSSQLHSRYSESMSRLLTPQHVLPLSRCVQAPVSNRTEDVFCGAPLRPVH